MANGDGWLGFVNIRLETEHKKAIKAYAEALDGDTILAELIELIDDGYQVSLSPDKENASIIATLTGKDGDCVNSGYSMSQRHDDPVVAVAALLFAHKELAQRDAWVKVQYDWQKTDW